MKKADRALCDRAVPGRPVAGKEAGQGCDRLISTPGRTAPSMSIRTTLAPWLGDQGKNPYRAGHGGLIARGRNVRWSERFGPL